MILKIKHFVLFVTIGVFTSCKQSPSALTEIHGESISIDSLHTPVDSIENFVKPYRERINTVLDSTLAFAPYKISKDDGIFNTTAGNLMADIVYTEANPIYKSRTGNEIDFVLLNHGGIRSIISKGNVSARTAYEVMPFDNSIVVVEMKGKPILDMISYLIESKRAHPVSGIQIVLTKNNKLHALNIQGKPFDENATYHVATSNYLVTGGDDMKFFKDILKASNTDYLIRNAIIDYFKKVDTLSPKIDDRFYKLN